MSVRKSMLRVTDNEWYSVSWFYYFHVFHGIRISELKVIQPKSLWEHFPFPGIGAGKWAGHGRVALCSFKYPGRLPDWEPSFVGFLFCVCVQLNEFFEGFSPQTSCLASPHQHFVFFRALPSAPGTLPQWPPQAWKKKALTCPLSH